MNSQLANQYMFLVRGPCKDRYSPEEMQEHMQEVFAWIDDLTQKGIFSLVQPLTNEGKVVTGGNGVTVTDGIFAESKEAVGGFFIVHVPTMEEAVKIASESPMIKRGGALEVRQIAALKCD